MQFASSLLQVIAQHRTLTFDQALMGILLQKQKKFGGRVIREDEYTGEGMEKDSEDE